MVIEAPCQKELTMPQRHLTASDRTHLIKLASELPKGSEERRAILSGLSKKGSEAVFEVPLKVPYVTGKADDELGFDEAGTNDLTIEALKKYLSVRKTGDLRAMGDGYGLSDTEAKLLQEAFRANSSKKLGVMDDGGGSYAPVYAGKIGDQDVVMLDTKPPWFWF
jgi:hypothetical protein